MRIINIGRNKHISPIAKKINEYSYKYKKGDHWSPHYYSSDNFAAISAAFNASIISSKSPFRKSSIL